MSRRNPAWARRPRDKQWDAHEDAELITAMRIGAMIEVLPEVLPGHCFGDILKRRVELSKEGRLVIADPL